MTRHATRRTSEIESSLSLSLTFSLAISLIGDIVICTHTNRLCKCVCVIWTFSLSPSCSRSIDRSIVWSTQKQTCSCSSGDGGGDTYSLNATPLQLDYDSCGCISQLLMRPSFFCFAFCVITPLSLSLSHTPLPIDLPV